MAIVKHNVTIKGVRDGLVFLLDDTCEYDALVAELEHKLNKTHQNILTGPAIQVTIKLGSRLVTEEQKEQIRGIVAGRGNLLVQAIESQAPPLVPVVPEGERISVLQGVVRSGQTVHHEGNLLYLGDVNPGGAIICTGDIFVMGSLRGMAHAGSEGNEASVIAASYLRPTQLRIAGVISRPPDEWGIDEAYMEFAYLRDGKMEIDKLAHLHRYRNKE